MKKIGLVGGLSWRSTVEYYAGLSQLSEQRSPPAGARGLEMSLESLDLAAAFAWLGRDGDEASWAAFDRYHHDALARLEAGGADLALIASNTPHHRFDAIVRGIGIPVVNLFDATALQAARIGAAEVLILGTALTMTSAKIRESFAALGVTARGPEDAGVAARTTDLIGRLQRGDTRAAATDLAAIVAAAAPGFDATPVVCLACTELPLAFGDEAPVPAPVREQDGIRYIDTIRVHIESAFAMADAGSGASTAVRW